MEDPIVIVGMGCRLPGEIRSPSDLWKILQESRSAQSDFPANRLNISSWYHPDSQRPGAINTRGGYFLSHDDSYQNIDSSFFGISPLEAATMDPQQRKLLEVVYESFESAGVSLDDVNGSDTACYVGNFTSDALQMQAKDVEFGAAYTMTGGGLTILSNRINYVFNLKGPSFTIDTACSSTMYALHLACNSILTGDCSAAVVGGTNLVFGVEQQIGSVRLGVLSPTSTCHTFDSSADGYARADAVGALYLKRLSSALAAGNPIRAVIRSTAINTNGRGPGISHPSAQDQERVMRAAYANANLDFHNTGYIECHGTGTPVGDPLEVSAIGNVFAASREVPSPLLLGSVKTNLGHGEAASAIPALIKVILSLEKGAIPATIGVQNINPNINLRDGRLCIVREATNWPAMHSYRRASVNSFGYGGANAHAVLDAAECYIADWHKNAYGVNAGLNLRHPPAIDASTNYKDLSITKIDHSLPYGTKLESRLGMLTTGQLVKNPISIELIREMDDDLSGSYDTPSSSTVGSSVHERSTFLLPFAAHNSVTLKQNVTAILAAADDKCLTDLAFTLTARCGSFPSRAFAIVTRNNAAPLKTVSDRLHFNNVSNQPPTLAFVLTGQGAQWPQMGLTLVHEYPSARRTLDNLDSILASLPDAPSWSLLEIIEAPLASSTINEALKSQTLCTAVQIVIVDLLKGWGISPKAVVGHSSGEIAAAYCAGYLTSAEAIITAYYRGVAVTRHNTLGAMLAVGLGAEEVTELINSIPDLTIACHNSPRSTTLSGTVDAVDAASVAMMKQGVFNRKLATSGNAYHSRLMQTASEEYQSLLDKTTHEGHKSDGSSNVRMVSSVTGETVASDTIDIKYWSRNLESPVLFNQAVSHMLYSDPEINHIIEIGPHSALGGPIKDINASLKSREPVQYYSAIKRNDDNVSNILTLAGNLFLAGYKVALNEVNSDQSIDTESGDISTIDSGSLVLDLPPYQWAYEDPLWVESRLSTDIRFREYPRHDLLGSRIAGTSKSAPSWRNVILLDNLPWLGDHMIGEEIIFPAAGYASMAIEAASQFVGRDVSTTAIYTLSDIKISSALILKKNAAIETIFDMWSVSSGDSSFDFKVSTVSSGAWTEHSAGSVQVSNAQVQESTISWSEYKGSRNGLNKQSNDRRWYERMTSVGLVYGPSFKSLSNILCDSENAYASADIYDKETDGMIQESEYIVHPTTIDGCLQLGIIAAHEGDPENLTRSYLPVTIRKLCIGRVDPAASHDALLTRGKGQKTGVRSIGVTTTLSVPDGSTVLNLEADFISLDNAPSNPEQERLSHPYSRLVWKPDIDRMSQEQMRSLFKSNSAESAFFFSRLEEVSELSVLGSAENLIDIDATTLPSHFGKFVRWVREQSQALSARNPDAAALSPLERLVRVENIVQDIGSSVPEARMVAKLNSKIGDIVTGGVGALDVMLEDGLMTEIYENGYGQVGAYAQLQEVMALVAHKQPGLRVLELGAGTGGATKPMLAALGSQDAFPKYSSYMFTDISMAFLATAREKLKEHKSLEFGILEIEQDPIDQGYEEESFDIVFASNVIHATSDVSAALRNCRKLLKVGGRLIIIETTKDRVVAGFMLGLLPGYWAGSSDGRPNSPFMNKEEWDRRFQQAGFGGVEIALEDYPIPNDSTTVLMSRKNGEIEHAATNGISRLEPSSAVWLIYQKTPHPMLQTLQRLYETSETPWRLCTFAEYLNEALPGSRTVFGVELEAPVLANMTKLDMMKMKAYAKKAQTCIWLTDGGVLDGTNPSKSLVFGLAKSVMTEQPSFNIASIDFEPEEYDLETYAQLIQKVEVEFHEDPASDMETELVLKAGRVYISRYLNDENENADYHHQVRVETRTAPVADNHWLQFEKEGSLDSFYLQEKPSQATELREKQVLIKAEAFGLDANLLDGIRGKRSVPYSSLSSGGTVEAVGPGVAHIRSGDRVVCIQGTHFDTTFITDETSCSIIPKDTRLEEVVSHVLPWTIAVHTLRSVCSVASGSRVLINCAGDISNVSLVQVAARLGAEVTATFASETEKRALGGVAEVNTVPIDELKVLKSQAFQIILTNRLTADHRDLSALVRTGGHVIFFGQQPSNRDAGIVTELLGMRVTVSSVDPVQGVLSGSIPITSALPSAVEMLNTSKSSQQFEVANMDHFTEAATILSSDSSKTVTLVYTPETRLPTRVSADEIAFPNDASYILVGCLGGLGRSLVIWMISHGARHFIFLSRSGAEKPHAAALVDELSELQKFCHPDLEFQVIRGDVARREDVERAIAAATTPIKGVIQAAMVLKDTLFTSMTHTDFNRAIHPKLLGTQHLHTLLAHLDLDFFVMTSSVLGAIGAATQSNYSAANAYLDHLARHRHALGLQATSVALGMIVDVGHVEEHPDVETALKRNGMYGIRPAEYLHAMARACRRQTLPAAPDPGSMFRHDPAARAYLATGMDPSRLSRAGGKTHWLRDARLRHLVHALDATAPVRAAPEGSGSASAATAAAQVKAAAAAGDALLVSQLVRNMLWGYFSTLILLPEERLEGGKALSVYGMDSMISAEIRRWAWRELGVDVPFLRMLEGGFTLEALEGWLVEGVLRARKAEEVVSASVE